MRVERVDWIFGDARLGSSMESWWVLNMTCLISHLRRCFTCECLKSLRRDRAIATSTRKPQPGIPSSMLPLQPLHLTQPHHPIPWVPPNRRHKLPNSIPTHPNTQPSRAPPPGIYILHRDPASYVNSIGQASPSLATPGCTQLLASWLSPMGVGVGPPNVRY